MKIRAGWDRGRPWVMVVLPLWAQRFFGVMFLDDLWARWSCDQCEAMGIKRDVALIFGRHWKHELSHSDAEWSAAGYDKAGTLAFYQKPPVQHKEDRP